MFNYDGRAFRAGGEQAIGMPTARYHQNGDLLWGEFAGGDIRQGSLAGTCSPDGVLHFAYCMVLDSGEVVSGRCRSTPFFRDDGRIRLNEQWERYTPRPEAGFSFLDEITAREPGGFPSARWRAYAVRSTRGRCARRSY